MTAQRKRNNTTTNETTNTVQICYDKVAFSSTFQEIVVEFNKSYRDVEFIGKEFPNTQQNKVMGIVVGVSMLLLTLMINWLPEVLRFLNVDSSLLPKTFVYTKYLYVILPTIFLNDIRKSYAKTGAFEVYLNGSFVLYLTLPFSHSIYLDKLIFSGLKAKKAPTFEVRINILYESTV
jgi:hypothetical protein